MRPGEEGIISALIATVFEQFVAPLYAEEGRLSFLSYCSREQLQSRASRDHIVLVAEAGSAAVGAAELRGTSHISLLFVAAAAQRQGVARALVAEAVRRGCASFDERRQLTVHASPNAVSAYESLGFRAQGAERCDGGIRFVPMVLSIP